MYSPFRPAVFTALLLFCPNTLVFSYPDETGYYADDNQEEEPIDVVDMNSVCPTDQLLRLRGTCKVNGEETQCITLDCCDTHVLIAGRCISKDIDPCSLRMCEQACDVKELRVWCKCYRGFRFNAANYKNKMQPYCVDVDECSQNNAGCDERCVNDPGGFHCECSPPFALGRDGRTCLPPRVPIVMPAPLPLTRAGSRPQCFSSCHTVSRLSDEVTHLRQQLHTVQGKLELLMEDPRIKDDRFSDGTSMYRVLDSTAPLVGGHCRCERGPRGPAGPPGVEGPRGAPGEAGPPGKPYSLDNMMFLLASINHDIKNLQDKLYADGEMPEPFDIKKALSKRKYKASTNQDLAAFTSMPTDQNSDTLETSPSGPNVEISPTSTTDWMMNGNNSSPYAVLLNHLRLLANITKDENDDDHTYDDDAEYD